MAIILLLLFLTVEVIPKVLVNGLEDSQAQISSLKFSTKANFKDSFRVVWYSG